MEFFDLIIIGAGPAGLSASVYASRYGIKHLVIGEITGGLTTQTFEIGNWIGTENISGQDFASNAAKHAESYGVEIRSVQIISLHKEDTGDFVITCADGKVIKAKTVIAATGTHHRFLGVKGEQELAGKGVSYCPTCDGFFFQKKTIAVIGGGDSAAEAATYLSKICTQVFLVVRGKALSAEQFWQSALAQKDNVTILLETNALEISGEMRVENIFLDKPFQGNKTLLVDGVFVEIGLTPNTKFLKACGAELDEQGYVKVDTDQSTTLAGLWAAGDATTSSNYFRQIVTAASEGAIAAHSIAKFLQS
jgi:thioredoxin-disulfide reductase